MLSNQTEIFISAGEQSGDLHASSLIKEIKHTYPGTKFSFTGLGGNLMKKENVRLLYHIDQIGIVGFTDVLKKINLVKKLLDDCTEYIRNHNPKLIILVDYPGFNLKLSAKLRKFYKGKIVYFIAPQIWAWHEKRILTIKKYIDKVLVILPFEESIYKSHNIDVKFIGHPLVKKIRNYIIANPKPNRKFGETKKATILPGSRVSEVKHHLPILMNTAEKLIKEFDIEVTISNSNPLNNNLFQKFRNRDNKIKIVDDNIYSSILYSDIVLSKSGTSTLECALFGVPFLIFYKTNLINYHAAKQLVKINKVGLANIIADKFVVKEFIQNDFNVENLMQESRKILTDHDYSEKMKQELNKTWNILGDKDCFKMAIEEIRDCLQNMTGV